MEDKLEIQPQSDLDELVERVEHGATVELTREGKTVARIIPAESQKLVPVTWEELTAFRRKLNIKTDDMTIKDMINDGRRL